MAGTGTQYEKSTFDLCWWIHLQVQPNYTLHMQLTYKPTDLGRLPELGLPSLLKFQEVLESFSFLSRDM